jgi:hypothetical protein
VEVLSVLQRQPLHAHPPALLEVHHLKTSTGTPSILAAGSTRLE